MLVVVVVPYAGEAALFVEYVLLVDVPLFIVELLFDIELEGDVLLTAFVLSVVTGEVYVALVFVLVVEYEGVVVCAWAMPMLHRQIARSVR
ncbi:hypothetical protein GCM10028773_38800 [Spirosoma koreense]